MPYLVGFVNTDKKFVLINQPISDSEGDVPAMVVYESLQQEAIQEPRELDLSKYTGKIIAIQVSQYSRDTAYGARIVPIYQ